MSPPRQKVRILCVDDSEYILLGVADVLGRGGYEIDSAADGAAALDKVSRNPQAFQLVVTDIRMPRLDGFGVIEESRSAGYGGPFIVYSASITAPDRERLLELRVSRILDKPAHPSQLLAAVREALSGF